MKVEYRSRMLKQRRKRTGKTRLLPLTNEQIRLLDKIDFPWNPNKKGINERVWHIKYQELVGFYEKHGHLNVDYGSSLYQWIIRQRQRRNGKHSPLTDEQIRLLDDVDFPCTPNSTLMVWHIKYQELVRNMDT
ncbi:unnamed protein product [Cylindrotheca closterium]|uniref:Helicase-associated domain-containing protein n=1 Tax=Cylindrotheca closterium TaxID=2856 RepID=A0AAD2GAJ6_9STRA|nr:unnamed protein product [Cylindrotheca closterium]